RGGGWAVAARGWAWRARRTNRRCNGWSGSRPPGPGTPARCVPSGGASRNGATRRPPPRTLAGWHATCGDTARLESRSVSPVPAGRTVHRRYRPLLLPPLAGEAGRGAHVTAGNDPWTGGPPPRPPPPGRGGGGARDPP